MASELYAIKRGVLIQTRLAAVCRLALDGETPASGISDGPAKVPTPRSLYIGSRNDNGSWSVDRKDVFAALQSKSVIASMRTVTNRFSTEADWARHTEQFIPKTAWRL